MYNPFVRACNCALENLSKIKDIDGLPGVLEDNKIVFARNHDRAIESGNHQRISRARPDIVLLSWKIFKKRRGLPDVPYSQSHEGDICVSKSDTKLSWKDIRSTVEVKFSKFQKLKGSFNAGFKALKELPVSNHDDTPQTVTSHATLSTKNCEYTPFGGFLSLIYLERSHPELVESG